MTRIFSIAALAFTLAVTAAACDDSPTEPGPGGTPNPTFRATLSPANEVPPITNAEAGGSGVMNITINATRDAAGTITAATTDFNGTLTGFPAGTVITLSHIHTGVAGVNGGVVVNLALTPGEITLPNGSGTIVKNGIATTVDVANQIIANPAAFYFNAHTALNPGGVVRGQLVRTN
jgi:hypothetical protein